MNFTCSSSSDAGFVPCIPCNPARVSATISLNITRFSAGKWAFKLFQRRLSLDRRVHSPSSFEQVPTRTLIPFSRNRLYTNISLLLTPALACIALLSGQYLAAVVRGGPETRNLTWFSVFAEVAVILLDLLQVPLARLVVAASQPTGRASLRQLLKYIYISCQLVLNLGRSTMDPMMNILYNPENRQYDGANAPVFDADAALAAYFWLQANQMSFAPPLHPAYFAPSQAHPHDRGGPAPLRPASMAIPASSQSNSPGMSFSRDNLSSTAPRPQPRRTSSQVLPPPSDSSSRSTQLSRRSHQHNGPNDSDSDSDGTAITSPGPTLRTGQNSSQNPSTSAYVQQSPQMNQLSPPPSSSLRPAYSQAKFPSASQYNRLGSSISANEPVFTSREHILASSAPSGEYILTSATTSGIKSPRLIFASKHILYSHHVS
ncbi:hypothetical protein MSAN_01676100 [Mycena sanguinolenta]|uniref:Uncharacterized protein n=1 Tax=Mycena sanguinolenta TaxID=230812 RepID=A0A8H6Y2S5_9AGAR|nr:hypothetical protein MSAN_01676100 [Mycena sanguinolenta]